MMRQWDFPFGATLCVAAFKNTVTELASGFWLDAAYGGSAKDKVCDRKTRKGIEPEMKTEKEKGKLPRPSALCRHWFIILISLISTAEPIFQMSFSNLCQTAWPFFLIQLMTRRICNSDWVFYRHSSRHTRVFVCLSLSVFAIYFRGGGGLGAFYTREKLVLLQNMCLQGIKP